MLQQWEARATPADTAEYEKRTDATYSDATVVKGVNVSPFVSCAPVDRLDGLDNDVLALRNFSRRPALNECGCQTVSPSLMRYA